MPLACVKAPGAEGLDGPAAEPVFSRGPAHLETPIRTVCWMMGEQLVGYPSSCLHLLIPFPAHVWTVLGDPPCAAHRMAKTP